jgi:outer membrane lipoprotein SlyB
MTGKKLLLALPLLLAVSLGACASNGVQPGYVNRSGPPSGYSNASYNQSSPQNQPTQVYQSAAASGPVNDQGNGPVAGTTPLDPNDPSNGAQGQPPVQQASASYPSNNGNQANYGNPNSGRVVSINEVALRGNGGNSGGGFGQGTMTGGLLGGAGGAIIGASTSHSLGGGLIGGLLGAVIGGVAGTIYDQHGGGASGGRGIEVTVQRDDGQTVTVAQRDDGDIQLGDRVQVVQGRNGAAQVVRDTQRAPD